MFSCLSPSETPLPVSNVHELEGILLPTPEITPHKHEHLWPFFILTTRFCPITVDTHELYSASQFFRDFPLLSSKEGLGTPPFKSHLQPMANSGNVFFGGGRGPLIFCMCSCADLLSTLSGNLLRGFKSCREVRGDLE